jgi:ankyrin repeat protein
VNSLSHNNSTPLHDAANFGRVGAVKILLDAGANINAKNDKEQTPRTMASKISKEHLRIRELLDEYDPASVQRNNNLHEGKTEEDFGKFVELSTWLLRGVMWILRQL